MGVVNKWPEHEYIVEHYPLLGAESLARRLKKHPATVRNYASKHGITFGVGTKHVTIGRLARMAGHTWHMVNGAALRDGKKRTRITPGGRVVAYVSAKWADEYLATRSRPTIAEMKAEGWLGPKEAAAALGIDSNNLVAQMSSQRGLIYRLLSETKVVKLPRSNYSSGWFFNPLGVAAVARKLREQKQRARQMVSSKVIAAYLDHLGHRMVLKAMSACPSYVVLRTNRTTIGHISHEDAGKLLARYGVSYEDPGPTRPGDPASASRNLEDARPGLHRAVGSGGAGSTRDVRAEQRLLHSPARTTEFQEGSR